MHFVLNDFDGSEVYKKSTGTLTSRNNLGGTAASLIDESTAAAAMRRSRRQTMATFFYFVSGGRARAEIESLCQGSLLSDLLTLVLPHEILRRE